MVFRFVTVAVGTVVLGLGAAEARAVAQISGPRELPPAGYSDQTYVDSKGCVFMRAGVGRNVSWVARVSKDRKPLCGYPPSLAVAAAPAAPAPTPAPAQAPAPAVRVAQAEAAAPTAKPAPQVPTKPVIEVAAAAPVEVAAPTPKPTPQVPAKPAVRVAAVAPAQAAAPATPPVAVAAAPASSALTPVASTPGPNQVACPAAVPVAALYATAHGGHVVLCTLGDGTLVGARAPFYTIVAQGVGNRIGAGIYEPGVVVDPGLVDPGIAIPAGYKLAWNDDRLNPNRGRGTAAGQAQQDQRWTRDVPAVLVASSQSQPLTPAVRAQARVSTKTEPNARLVAPVAADPVYVQVGTFAVPSNAEGAKARLRSAGLPVGTAKITKGGKALQIIVAGPYADAGAAQAALLVARNAGFKDAFLR